MKTITVTGSVNFSVLYADLRAALGDPSSPQRWYFTGEQGAVTVFYAESILDSVVQNALVAHLDPAVVQKRVHNEPLDQQMTTLEMVNSITPRSLREGFLVGAQQSPAVNIVIASIETKLNEIIAYLKSKDAQLVMADASVGRVPDATLAAGIRRLAQLDAAVTALRNLRT